MSRYELLMKSSLAWTRLRLLPILALAMSALLESCASTDETVTPGPGPGETIIDADTTLDSLILDSGDTVTIANGAVLTVSGDARLDGTLRSTDGAVNLRVDGNLEINGSIQASKAASTPPDVNMPFASQGSGVYVRVTGDLIMGPDSSVDSDGDIVITDDDAQFARTPQEAYDEADSDSGSLPTLVPLPPTANVETWLELDRSPNVIEPTQQVHRVTGNWDLSDRPGDRPILHVFFNGNRTLQLDDWTLTSPPGVPGDADAPDPGEDAQGMNGRNGMNLNIWNNGGSIQIMNTVTLNLAPGGDGGEATASCASATGGDGGQAGNFRMTAAGGIDITMGTLNINPGRAGNGGQATVSKATPGAVGCPGEDGQDANANGGKGGDNRKRLRVRGTVNGLNNVNFGDVTAGNGGNAEATACDGGPGDPCCDGGNGGGSDATAGAGGEASLDLGGSGVNHTGMVRGGDGGSATATGGNGGLGGACKSPKGGKGGNGGPATANNGAGGNATAAGGAGNARGGNTGDVTATGGNAGSGGNVGSGEVGMAGNVGSGTATAATPGTPDGQAGSVTQADGQMGSDGVVDESLLILFCIPSEPLVQGEGGQIQPGTYPLPVQVEGAAFGMANLNLVDQKGAAYFTSAQPTPHYGFDGGVAEYDVSMLEIGRVTGIRIVTLPEFNNTNAKQPLQVNFYDVKGQPAGSFPLPDFPRGPTSPSPAEFDVDFGEFSGPISKFSIVVPPGSFATFVTVYIIDP